MIHRILNAANVLGAIAFLALIGTVGAADWAIENDGSYCSTIVLMVVFAGCAYLAIKEDGKKR